MPELYKGVTAHTDDDIRGEILWFESILDCIEDGDLDAAREAVKAAIKLLRKKVST